MAGTSPNSNPACLRALPFLGVSVLFLCHPPSPGSLFSLYWCSGYRCAHTHLCLGSYLALHQAHVSKWFPARDHCPQHSTGMCPPHSVTLYSIIPSLPAETSPSDHFPAQETILPPITYAFYWSFISPSALLQVIVSPSWLPAAVSASVLGPPTSHIYSSGKGTTLRSRINFY